MRLSLVLVLLGSGCAAARSGYVLINAQRSVEKAMQAGAEKRAPYEYTMAVEYYHKACEENTYSDYGSSDTLAQSSITWAERALEATADAEKEFGEDFVPEKREEKKPEEKKPNTLDQIDLDEI